MLYENTRVTIEEDSSAQWAVSTHVCPLHDVHNFHKILRGRTTTRRSRQLLLTNKLHSFVVV